MPPEAQIDVLGSALQRCAKQSPSAQSINVSPSLSAASRQPSSFFWPAAQVQPLPQLALVQSPSAQSITPSPSLSVPSSQLASLFAALLQTQPAPHALLLQS